MPAESGLDGELPPLIAWAALMAATLSALATASAICVVLNSIFIEGYPLAGLAKLGEEPRRRI